MQWHRIAAATAAAARLAGLDRPTSFRALQASPRGSVTGLGVVDALRLELLPVQVPSLRAELNSLRRAIKDGLEPDEQERARLHGATDKDFDLRRYELRLLDLMVERAPRAAEGSPPVFIGPANLTREVVTGALRSAVDDFSAFLDKRDNAADIDSLRRQSHAVLAWARTYVDLRAVETFNFDPEADPSSPDFY